MAGDLVGFLALGRKGSELGIVVEQRGDAEGATGEIVVRGGVSAALVYVLPPACVRAISLERKAVVFDVDLIDFVPTLHPDGTIELRVSSG